VDRRGLLQELDALKVLGTHKYLVKFGGNEDVMMLMSLQDVWVCAGVGAAAACDGANGAWQSARLPSQGL
jgi:hypothetical protein